jgi:hypothetical protein
MAAKSPMSSTLPYGSTRAVPESASGDIQPRDDGGDELIAIHMKRWDDLVKGAVQRWGGQASMAALLGKSESDICDRLNRKIVKGALMRPFTDYEQIATTHPDAAEFFVFGICDLLGYEHPKKKRIKTETEKLDALVKSLRRCGPLGEAAIERAAKELGADVSEFDK